MEATKKFAFGSVDEAKEFLIHKISEQAIIEGSPLSESDRKLLFYSEDKRTVGNEVVADYPDDNSLYESRINGLLRRSFQRELSQPQKGQAEKYLIAVETLKSGDHYLSVMANGALAGTSKAVYVASAVSVAIVLFLIWKTLQT